MKRLGGDRVFGGIFRDFGAGDWGDCAHGRCPCLPNMQPLGAIQVFEGLEVS